MLYKEIVRGNVIRKHIVKKYLDTVVIKWSEEMDDFREDYDVPCKIKFNDEEFDAIFVQGHDGSGSCGTEEQFLLNASTLLGGYWPENLIKQGMKEGSTMPIEGIIKNERECKLISMITATFNHISIYSPKELSSARVRLGKQINELGELLQARKKEICRTPNTADIGIFIWLCLEYSSNVKNCKNYLITAEDDKVNKLKRWAEEYMLEHGLYHLKNKVISDVFTEERIDKHLTESKDHSKKFKVVVSRHDDGSSADHYDLHSPLLPLDADDEYSIKEHFDWWEEFLSDEDGRLAERNLRDVTVREVRLGKIVAKIEPVQEVVYKVVKK
jgi:hypothetical protein